ncbi:MAG: MarC family protein [Candidatus Syntrophoarchaeum sp.]|nr:MarC family protein [Candidatus Syntrophoarchaeum sp.]
MDTLQMFFLTAFTTIFVIVDPIGNVMVFLSLTEDKDSGERRRIAGRTAIFGSLVLLIFAIFGNYIFSFFQITVDSLRVIGGILILLIAMDMMHGKMSREGHTPEEVEESGERDDISFFPMAVPMLAGPGAITTAIILMNTAATVPFKLTVLISIILVFLICWFLFCLSEGIHRVLGVTGNMVITRMMGLILGAIAVQFITTGLWNIYMMLHGGIG